MREMLIGMEEIQQELREMLEKFGSKQANTVTSQLVWMRLLTS
jgi:hypothetical protein